MSKATKSVAAALVAACLLTACSSQEKRAAEAAGAAQQALAAGQPKIARALIQRALSERDDVSDYWLLLAQINLANQDLKGAFDAYENVVSFDRANVEALTRLCQIAITSGMPERAEKYADQLSLLSADTALSDTVKAGVAFRTGKRSDADRLLAAVLQAHPDDLGALMLQGRMFEADGNYTAAAGTMERSIATGGDPAGRLLVLLDYYKGARDRDGYSRTVTRLAQARPGDVETQLAYADLLYERGEREGALGVVRAVMTKRPNDVATAAAIVNLWLRQGADAVPTPVLAADARGASLEMRSAYAQYAAETGRPEIAAAILDGVDAAPPDPANADAKATLAYVRGLRGASAEARAALDAILAEDPQQPRARLARGRLRALAGDLAGGIEDLRQVIADDAGNVAARLDLADFLVRRNDAVLAESLLREGLAAKDGDPRVAGRLARLLIANGRRADAAAMLADFARENPTSLRAQRLHATS